MPKIDPASPKVMTPEASKRSVSAFGILLLATPALVILLLISIYAVNVPYWDQWDEVPRLIEKMNSGTLGLPDFFAQHNEHRIVFPRLIMFGLALLTRWNIKVELVASWILACISAYNLWRLCRVTGFFGSTADFWLLFAANVLLFTPLQSENWLWGFQIGFFFAGNGIHFVVVDCRLFTNLRCILICCRVFDRNEFFGRQWICFLDFSVSLADFSPRENRLPRAERMANAVPPHLYGEPDPISLELPKAYPPSEYADRNPSASKGHGIYFGVLWLCLCIGDCVQFC
jgi:hypothetical protein